MHAAQNALLEETGSALLSVLVLVTVLTLVVGAVMAVSVSQRHLVVRDVHRAQARYAAEAAVYRMMVKLEERPMPRSQRLTVPVPGGGPVEVAARPFGGFWELQAEARVGRSRARVWAVVGQRLPEAFTKAVVLGDTARALTVAGTTRLTGPLLLGPRGVRTEAFKGQGYSGTLDGPVERQTSFPAFDPAFFHAAVASAETFLQTPPDARITVEPGRASRLPAVDPAIGRPVYVVPGSWQLDAVDTLRIALPFTLVAGGDLTLNGPIHLPTGSRLIAGRALTLSGAVTGKDLWGYGRDAVAVQGAAQVSGQLFANRRLRVVNDAVVSYPSVLYVSGTGRQPGRLEVLGRSRVEGTLIYPVTERGPDRAMGRIVIGPDARVKGAVYSAAEVMLHGRVDGTVVAHRFYDYAEPTVYLNWLIGPTVDVTRRPEPYVLPLFWGDRPELDVLVLQEEAL